MIAFIRGKIASYGADYIVIDNNGIGWQCAYPHTDQVHLNEEVSVYTYMHITENDVSLFGFRSQAEKDLFLKLISVKGLGPKTAMLILASHSYAEVINAIETGNVSFLTNIKGLGKKTASQIILDLKGKLVQPAESKKTDSNSAEIQEALEGLANLGYKPAEINQAAKAMNENPGLTTEQYLKMGLQFLMRKKLGG